MKSAVRMPFGLGRTNTRYCDIDICLTLKGIKLISEGNTLYLTGKLCSCQLM